MAPVRGNKKKRKVEEEEEQQQQQNSNNNNNNNNAQENDSLVFPVEGSVVLSKIVAGNPSSSQLLYKFKSTFKMSRKTFDYICSLVKDYMMVKSHSFTNGKPMSLNDQVALALTRLSSGNSLISVGDSFGAHHSTVSQVTWRFVEAIEENGLRHIQWPSSGSELTEIKGKFENVRGLPNCCGAIGTTHITMLLTSSDPESDTWLDSNENHSMILQAIVDPDLRFRDIVTGWPGNMNDYLVLKSSNFYKLCQKGTRLNGNKTSISEERGLREYIIGDPAFPLLPWLVTPYQGRELSETKLEFNKRLKATHDVAQRALARLKGVWRMIQGGMWRPDKHKLPRFILVCCILHNIVIDIDNDVYDDRLPLSLNHDPGYGQEVCEFVDEAGLILREKLCMCFSGR